MNNLSFKIARQVIAKRAYVAFAFLVITIFFAFGVPKVDIRTIFADLLPADDPFVQTFKEHPNFGNPLTITVMVKRTDGELIYNEKTLQKVWDLTRDIDLIEGVDHDRIISITTEKANYAEATSMGVEMQPLMGDRIPQGAAELKDLQRRVERSPMARTYLVSSDEKATLIRAGFHEHLLDYGHVFSEVQRLAKEASDGSHTIRVVGQPVLTGWIYLLQEQTYAIFAVTVGLLLLALAFYMRNLAGIATPILCSAVAATWGFGLVGWLESPIEPLLMVVPLLLIARSFSHCVQYTERYYEIFSELKDKKLASEATLAVMMAPSVFGIVTDTLAILCIGVAPIPAMQRFALFCGFWAFFLIPTGVMLIAVLLSYLPTPKNIDSIIGAGEKEKGIHGVQKRVLTSVGRLITGNEKRTKLTATVVCLVSVVVIIVSRQVAIGNPTEGSNLLWDESEFNVGTRDVNDHFPGVNSLEIILESKDPGNVQARAARSKEAYEVSKAIVRSVMSGDNPAKATRSFSDFMEEGSRLYSGGHPAWLSLDPTDRAVNAAGVAVAFGQNPLNFADVTDFQFQHSAVSLFYRDNKQETIDKALAAAKQAVSELGDDHETINVRMASGTIALQEAQNQVVKRYEWIMLGLACVAIFFIASFAYKSFVASLVLLVPVVLANFYLTAAMHMLGIGLDINSVMVAVLGVGVGIDYGIYLMSRICEEYSAQGESWEKAIVESLTTTGKAIMFTASIMLVGILPWYFLSDLKFMADMGLLLSSVMLINMVLALLVLPLIVYVLKPKFVTRNDLMVGESLDMSWFDQGEAETKESNLDLKKNEMNADRVI